MPEPETLEEAIEGKFGGLHETDCYHIYGSSEGCTCDVEKRVRDLAQRIERSWDAAHGCQLRGHPHAWTVEGGRAVALRAFVKGEQ